MSALYTKKYLRLKYHENNWPFCFNAYDYGIAWNANEIRAKLFDHKLGSASLKWSKSFINALKMYVDGHMRVIVYVCVCWLWGSICENGRHFMSLEHGNKKTNEKNADKMNENVWNTTRFFLLLSDCTESKIGEHKTRKVSISQSSHFDRKSHSPSFNPRHIQFFPFSFFYLTAFCTVPNISFLSETIASDIVRWIRLNCTT